MYRATGRRLLGKDTQTLVNESQSKLNALVVDYFSFCNRVGTKFHAPLLVGTRTDGLRGLYLAEGHRVERNKPLLTVPYSAFITHETLAQLPGALKNVDAASLKQYLVNADMEPLLPAISSAIQLAVQVERLPRNTGSVSAAASRAFTKKANGEPLDSNDEEVMRKFGELVSLYTTELMPWARMTDDEDWNEQHVQELYKGVLDQFQALGYDDMLVKFGQNLSRIHAELVLAPKLDNIRRLTRVVIGRTDLVPPPAELMAPHWQKRMWKWWRAATKQKTPQMPVIVPALELVNHSGRPNVVAKFGVFDGVPAMRLMSLRAIDGGREVCRHYNFALDRGAALFRYGFLPFEVASVPQLDQWRNHYLNDVHPNLGEISDTEKAKQAAVQADVDRLERMFTGKQQ
jgi:hypothetical protein